MFTVALQENSVIPGPMLQGPVRSVGLMEAASKWSGEFWSCEVAREAVRSIRNRMHANLRIMWLI